MVMGKPRKSSLMDDVDVGGVKITSIKVRC